MLEESVSFIPSIWASMNSWFTPTVFFLLLNLMIGTIFITSRLATQKHNEQQKQQQDHQPQPQLTRSPSVLQRLKSMNFYAYRSPEPNINFAQTQGFDAHFTTHGQEHEREEQEPAHWNRSPSVLQRLKSINLYSYLSPERSTLQKAQEEETHYFPQHVHKQEYDEEPEEEAEEEEEVEEEKGEEDRIRDQEQSLDEIYSQMKEKHVARTKSDTKPASGEIPTKLPRKMRKSASAKSAFAHFEEEDIVETLRPATVREGKAKETQEVDDEVDAKADDFINKFKHQLKLQRIDSILRYKETIRRGS